MRISVFRKAHFNAAHRLYNPSWTDEKNAEVFGLCNNPYFYATKNCWYMYQLKWYVVYVYVITLEYWYIHTVYDIHYHTKYRITRFVKPGMSLIKMRSPNGKNTKQSGLRTFICGSN